MRLHCRKLLAEIIIPNRLSHSAISQDNCFSIPFVKGKVWHEESESHFLKEEEWGFVFKDTEVRAPSCTFVYDILSFNAILQTKISNSGREIKAF
jgi:hypothetical protein